MPHERQVRRERAKRRVMARYGQNSLDKTAFTMNLSEDGAYLRTNSVFRPGTTIQVELDFQGRSFAMWARVQWAKKVPPQLAHTLNAGMGVRFLSPSPEWLRFFDEWSGIKPKTPPEGGSPS